MSAAAPPPGEAPPPGAGPRVALFVTCLVDLFRPGVGFAAVKLIEATGATVAVPMAQTCCGQPAYNSGDHANAAALARATIALLEGYDHIVAPSGSCAGMLRLHYPALLARDPAWAARARAFAAKCHELTAFLSDVMGVERLPARFEGAAAYHDSCSCLREVKVREQPRRLLAGLAGLELKELAEPEACCGFGGTFCVKYAAISTRMADEKLDDIAATGAQHLLAADLGCLLSLAGRSRRRGLALQVRHVAEVLAGMADTPAIGEGRKR